MDIHHSDARAYRSRPVRPTTTVYDSTRAFRAKNQVNVKKQMINYRASLLMQVYLRAPGRYAGKEEKKKQKETATTKKKRKKEDRTDLVSETTMLSSPAL